MKDKKYIYEVKDSVWGKEREKGNYGNENGD
jgi:hypothetical protein